MIGAPLKIVETVRVTLAERILPQLDAATWLAGDVRSSIALLTYLEDALTMGAQMTRDSNAAMTGFLKLAAGSSIPQELGDRIGRALAQADATPADDLAGQYAAGHMLKSALSAFIEAREAGRAGNPDLVEPLRSCLRQVAQLEQSVAQRAGAMTPF